MKPSCLEKDEIRDQSSLAEKSWSNRPGLAKSISKALILICLALLAYAPAISSGFIWDDDVMLTENSAIHSRHGLKTIWFSTELSDYFPLTSTMFWLEWRLWGLNPVGYNLVNILLHGSSAVLLWRLLRRLSIPGAYLASVLFVLHPVCVASVAWIAERKNTLSLALYLLTLILYARFRQDGKMRFYWVSFAVFILTVLAKTSAVMVPCVLLLIAWWEQNRVTIRDLLRTMPFFTVSLVFGLITVWFQSGRGPIWAEAASDDLITRLLGGTWATWFYCLKAIFPVNLSMIYPRWEIDRTAGLSYLPAVLGLGSLLLLWTRSTKYRKPVLFGLGFFLVNLAPVFGFFEMSFLIHSRVADHWQYIAIIGIISLFSAGLIWLLGRWTIPLYVVTASLVLTLFALTWKQAAVYKNEETLWTDTLAKNPSAWIAYTKLGDQRAQEQQFKEAAEHYLRSIELFPHHPMTHNNRGNVLSFQGRTNEALQHYFEALKLHPKYAEAHNNLGVHLLQLGDAEKALSHFREAIAIRQTYAAAHFNAGNALFKLAEYAEAEQHYLETVRLKPQIPEAHYNLALTLMMQGKNEEALEALRAVLRLRPDYPEALFEMQQLEQQL